VGGTFWILVFGFWIEDFASFGSQSKIAEVILDFGLPILDWGIRFHLVLNPKSKIA
jgi:hypothetical protein